MILDVESMILNVGKYWENRLVNYENEKDTFLNNRNYFKSLINKYPDILKEKYRLKRNNNDN